MKRDIYGDILIKVTRKKVKSKRHKQGEIQMIQFKTIQSLTGDEIKIRTEVFMHEQGFKNEYDEIDKIAYHTVLYNCLLYTSPSPRDS